jgi:hypothetical protein
MNPAVLSALGREFCGAHATYRSDPLGIGARISRKSPILSTAEIFRQNVVALSAGVSPL